VWRAALRAGRGTTAVLRRNSGVVDAEYLPARTFSAARSGAEVSGGPGIGSAQDAAKSGGGSLPVHGRPVGRTGSDLPAPAIGDRGRVAGERTAASRPGRLPAGARCVAAGIAG